MITKTAETQMALHKADGKNSSLTVRGSVTGQSGRNSSSGTAAASGRARSQQQELDEVRREHAKLQQAIYEAAQVQRRLCSPRELVCGEFEVAGEIFPVRHLCGDFFKAMQLEDELGLLVGDIAGKGLSAGIWQAHLMDLVQRCARTHQQPKDAISAVNRELCLNESEPPLAALFFGRLDLQRNELVYCNAGLPAALVLRGNRSVERLEKGGPMLGALEKATYSSGSVELNPGDMLLAYSDGLTECRNSRDEEFETERLSMAAMSLSGASASQVLFSTLATVLDFAAACPPEDDLTLLVVRRREAALAEPRRERNESFAASRRRATAAVGPRQAASRQRGITNS